MTCARRLLCLLVSHRRRMSTCTVRSTLAKLQCDCLVASNKLTDQWTIAADTCLKRTVVDYSFIFLSTSKLWQRIDT